jgi:AraC family transcriptional regulator
VAGRDDPQVTPPDKIRYDAAIAFDSDIKPEGEISVQDLPAGSYAVASHRGPYETIMDTWNELCGDWLPQSGYEVLDTPSFEIYRNNSQTTPAEELITDIYAPVGSVLTKCGWLIFP